MDIRKIISTFRDEGPIVTCGLIFRRQYEKAYNRNIAKKLGSVRNLKISCPAQISGLNHIRIGDNFSAGPYLRLVAIDEFNGIPFQPQIIIKNNVEINDFVHIAATNYVEIGNNVLIASHVYIADHMHGAYKGNNQTSPEVPPIARRLVADKKVIIEDNVWIGESVSILPGVTIGRGCIIGANSVVTKNITPDSIAVGCPARVIKKYDKTKEQWLQYDDLSS